MKIDWKAYYREFSKLHGGSPVVHGVNQETMSGGYLLFPDGWRYARNPEGPEYPPRDQSEQLSLVKQYWIIRRDSLQIEYDNLKYLIRGAVSSQQSKSAPLVVNSISFRQYIKRIRSITDPEYFDEVKVNQYQDIDSTQTEAVDYQLLLDEARNLKGEITRCEEMLKAVKIPEISRQNDGFNPAGILTELERIEGNGAVK